MGVKGIKNLSADELEQLLFMDFDKYAEEVTDAYHMFAEFQFHIS